MCKVAVVLFVVGCVVGERQPTVETPLGEVTGYFMKTRGGRDVAAFTSIPFAVPPLGDLRFRVSQAYFTELIPIDLLKKIHFAKFNKKVILIGNICFT